jgi:PmbA protein
MDPLLEDLVSTGCLHGADQVEVTYQAATEFGVDVRLGEIESLIEAGSTGVSIKVILDKKTAVATSSDLDRSTLEALVINAVQRAALANSDDSAGLPEDIPDPEDPAWLELHDDEITRLDAEKKISLARETEALALQDRRIINSHGANFETREIHTRLINSLGFSSSYIETYCSLGVGLQAGETDDLVEGYWGSAKRHFKDLEAPGSVAQKAVERTVRQLSPRKIKTQKVPVLFEPEMTGWLMGFLFSCVSGTAVYNRATFLLDKVGQPIADERVTVYDDGLLKRGLGSSPFDAEGVPCRKTPVIERGVLKNYLCNTYAARKLALSSTGNASGGGVAPTNFHLAAGSTTPADMIRSMDKGMILIRVLGHGLNPLTGDISRGAFGLWVEKGKILFPVSEITISGNLGKVLQDIVAVGNDLEFNRSVCGPSLLIEEMTVAGL